MLLTLMLLGISSIRLRAEDNKLGHQLKTK